jgi:predicted exporter
MRRAAAALWLALVLAACLHVGLAARHGLPLDSDLMALLPAEKLDPAIRQAEQAINGQLSRRLIVLFGAADPGAAREAAVALEGRLRDQGLLTPSADIPDPEAIRRLGAAYFPARSGLLAEQDRRRLLAGQGEALLERALGQIYGFGGISDGKLLARDPFLLFPAFLAALPIPAGHARLEDGRPVIEDRGRTWVGVTGILSGDATSLAFQKRFAAAFGAPPPGIAMLRLGAIFYASEATGRALALSSAIGGLSLLATALLLLLVFRAARPLLLGLLSIGIGLVVALSSCLLVFGTLHVAAQLFGASLIGIAADYSLLYFAQIFSPAADGRQRLRQAIAGISLGVATTAIGYVTLALSPFPGLRQVALFSAVGLVAAYATVALWFPLLDRLPARPLPTGLARAAARVEGFWSGRGRFAVALAALILAAAGYARLTIDDDVRHQQALDPGLMAQQAEVQRLLGWSPSTQFFLVEGADDEQALQREEDLAERLRDLAVPGWVAPAAFVPSQARQAANRALIEDKLVRPYLAELSAKTGMALPPPEAGPPVTLQAVRDSGAISLLPSMLIAPGRHLVLLEDAKENLAVLSHAADGLTGIRFVDPAGEISTVLAAYRRRAVRLLAASLLLMAPLVAWRYGPRGLLPVLGPPALAVVLTPALLALAGLPFTFFTALGLVLALSIGVDYAVFCAEDGRLSPVTMLGVTLAMSTAVLSFGLLAVSDIEGMRTFGAAMLVAVPLGWAMAPLAARARKRAR